MSRLVFKVRFIGLVALALVGAMWPVGAVAATASAPGLGSASSFAILSAAPGGGGAVTCTNGMITGDVGSSGVPASIVQTSCTINGATIAPVFPQVVTDFNTAYAAYAAIACDHTLTGTLAGVTLSPGVYCFDAAATLTGTLTLDGPSTGTWIFKIGTSGTGALTGTNFSVVMTGGAVPCSVNWWVSQAATMTTSNFIGTILAGAAITLTGGTFSGNALAKAAVTVTGTNLVGCAGSQGHGHGKQKCNQGVGNGPEGCDPGNSNQGDPSRSNDELGGTPGNPGRKGGNGKSSTEAAGVSSLNTATVAVAATSESHNSGASAAVAAKSNNRPGNSVGDAAKGKSDQHSNGKSKSKNK